MTAICSPKLRQRRERRQCKWVKSYFKCVLIISNLIVCSSRKKINFPYIFMAVLPGSVCGCARGHMHTQVFGIVGMGGVVVSKSYETLNWFMFPVVLGWKRLASVSDGEANDLTTSRLQILFSVPRHPAAHPKTRYSVGCISKWGAGGTGTPQRSGWGLGFYSPCLPCFLRTSKAWFWGLPVCLPGPNLRHSHNLNVQL